VWTVNAMHQKLDSPSSDELVYLFRNLHSIPVSAEEQNKYTILDYQTMLKTTFTFVASNFNDMVYIRQN
jgi:hypothetical protein